MAEAKGITKLNNPIACIALSTNYKTEIWSKFNNRIATINVFKKTFELKTQ